MLNSTSSFCSPALISICSALMLMNFRVLILETKHHQKALVLKVLKSQGTVGPSKDLWNFFSLHMKPVVFCKKEQTALNQ